jgi:hypothetical protein
MNNQVNQHNQDQADQMSLTNDIVREVCFSFYQI